LKSKRGHQNAASMAQAVSKHVTHYGPKSGFPHYNLTTPH